MVRELVLASASPRRRDLLTQMGIPFTVCSGDADENFTGIPQEMVAVIARRKTEEARRLYPDAVILSADTLVYAKGQILGKPRDFNDARAMLKILSDSCHDVYTGVCMIDNKSGFIQEEQIVTRVFFDHVSERAIERYIATGEPIDKAGAYGIQGTGGMFVSRIEGSYSNVIGLPMSTVRKFLINLGWQL